MTGMNGNTGRKITSLRELPRDVRPPSDLWPAIAARIAENPRHGARPARAAHDFWIGPSRMQWVALAAVVVALAVGMWVGRNVLPPLTSTPQQLANAGAGEFLPASYVTDPRYIKQRAEMIRTLEQQMETLPPDTKERVTASLATIHKSMRDIQEALGRDPGNALLQELLVNAYQDEMRVLTAVHEASDARQEI